MTRKVELEVLFLRNKNIKVDKDIFKNSIYYLMNKEQLAQTIYNFRMGCPREEAISMLGFDEKSYPKWNSIKKKDKFLNIAEKILKRNQQFTNNSLGKLLFEELDPESEYMWSINHPNDRVQFSGIIFNEFCLSEWQRDDYIAIAEEIIRIKDSQLNQIQD